MADKRTKIDILKLTPGQNSYGEPTDEWLPITDKKIWASKDPILGNEYFNAMATQTKVDVKFRMHYIKSVTNDMRVQDDEGIYEILSAINVKSLNRELLMYCKKVN